ncbi:hypothetical protein AmDm5_1035 [Acetobacter malorum]|nr:hypothetical protein AmDm5_1035 [Acetobacter malorum]
MHKMRAWEKGQPLGGLHGYDATAGCAELRHTFSKLRPL